MTLVYLAVAWTAGLVVCHLLLEGIFSPCSSPSPLFLLAAMAPLAATALRRDKRLALAACVCLSFLLGAWRYYTHPFNPCLTNADLAYFHADSPSGVEATIEGVIVDYPDVRDSRIQYHVVADSLSVDGKRRAVSGQVLVEGPRFPVYVYGDRIEAAGRLSTPPLIDGFDYRRYLAQRGIGSLLRRAEMRVLGGGEGDAVHGTLYAARGQLARVLNRVFPEPAAALANGMLLGIESGIPDRVDEAFKETGASHVIVISGSNIALFSGLLMAWAGRLLGRRRAALPVVAMIAAYVVLIGADAAAFRAGVMGAMLVLAGYFGRRSTGYVSLCAAGMLLTAVNPLSLWDLGFQLSFLATLGLILFSQPLARAFDRLLRRPGASVGGVGPGSFLRESLAVTVAAQVMTAPLLLASFGRISPVSLIVNALIVPVQPVVLIGGFATLAAGVLSEPVARLVALAPWLCLEFTVAVVDAAAKLPFASIDVGASADAWALLSASVTILAAAVWAWRRS